MTCTFSISVCQSGSLLIKKTPYCTGSIPPPRYGHSAVAVGETIVVFGGKGPKNVVYNDLYCFDSRSDQYLWQISNETGESPSPRFNHSAEIYKKKMYIFGGWNSKEFFGDLVVFDLEKNVWKKLEAEGVPPVARMGHGSCMVGHNMIIQGGFSFNKADHKKNLNNYGNFLKSCYLNDTKLLDIELNTWSQVRTNGQPPEPRFGHSVSFAS